MWIGKEGGSLIVIDIVQDGPAAKAGIKKNDRILKIADKHAQDFTIDEARARLRASDSEVVKITFQAGENVQDTLLKLRDLL